MCNEIFAVQAVPGRVGELALGSVNILAAMGCTAGKESASIPGEVPGMLDITLDTPLFAEKLKRPYCFSPGGLVKASIG